MAQPMCPMIGIRLLGGGMGHITLRSPGNGNVANVWLRGSQLTLASMDISARSTVISNTWPTTAALMMKATRIHSSKATMKIIIGFDEGFFR